MEVDKTVPKLEESEETAESIVSLQHHPGFLALTSKMKVQSSLLESKLKSERHKQLSDVEFLQSGVFWLGWLKQQVDQEVFRKSQPKPVAPSAPELEAFKRAQAALELIG